MTEGRSLPGGGEENIQGGLETKGGGMETHGRRESSKVGRDKSYKIGPQYSACKCYNIASYFVHLFSLRRRFYIEVEELLAS